MSDAPGGTPDASPAMIAAELPSPGTIGNRASSTLVSITFSKDLDCATVTDASLVVTGPAGAALGHVSCSGATLAFTPVFTLPTNTQLTASVDSAVRDADGVSLPAGITWTFDMGTWTWEYGTDTDDYPMGLALDAERASYLAGYTLGALDGATSAGGYDMFVVKHDATGKRLWGVQLGSTAHDYAQGIANDGAGGIYVTGSTEGDFAGSNAGSGDLVLVKLDAAGTVLWQRQLGSTGYDRAEQVAANASGAVIVGFTSGSLDGQALVGGDDAFIIAYDSSGAKRWTRTLGTRGDEDAYGVTLDGAGNIYVTGITTGALDGTPRTAVDEDVFVAKYDASGTLQWVRQLGSRAVGESSPIDEGAHVGLDGDGNVYVAGDTLGDFDGHTTSGGFDIFVVKFTADGTKQWSVQHGGTSSDQVDDGWTDAAGNTYVAGITWSVLDGESQLGQGDLMVMKFDAGGVRQWTRTYGTTQTDVGTGCAIDADGYVYVGGYTAGDLPGNTTAGLLDMFVVKYAGDGTLQ